MKAWTKDSIHETFKQADQRRTALTKEGYEVRIKRRYDAISEVSLQIYEIKKRKC